MQITHRYYGRILLLSLFFIVHQFSIAQIIAPAPPEISGGAEADLELVKSHERVPSKFIPAASVSSASPIFDAVNFTENGTNNAGSLSIPPDPCGAAGPNHVVNVVNRSIEWYTKTGTKQNSQSLQSFFTAITSTFDPKVIYDQYAGRFVVVTLETEGRDDMVATNDSSRIYLAVSKTSDPNAGWWFHTINSLTVISGNNTWADYPGFAIDEEAVYITNNMFAHEGMPFGTSPDTTANGGVRLWIVAKGVVGGFYQGAAASVNIYDPYATSGGFAITTQPAHTFGTLPAGVGTYLMGYGGLTNGTQEFVQWVRVNNPLGTPTFTANFVSLGDIENPVSAVPDAPQLGSDSLIDAGDSRALNAVWRDGKIAMCFTYLGSAPNAGQATAHWVLLNDNGGGAPSFLDQGDVGGEDISAGTYTYYPSVALNSNGDLAIGFSASSPSIYAGAYYTGREAGDAAGVTDPVKTLRAGVDWYLRKFSGTRNRWGDYTATVVDPSDDISFWVYNEYAITRGSPTTMPNEDGRWGTAFGKFTVGDCMPTLALAGVIPSGTYVAGNLITATGMINSPSVVFFNSGSEIQLDPQFNIALGASLEATTGVGCP